jgi:hypothetical protein
MESLLDLGNRSGKLDPAPAGRQGSNFETLTA